MSSIKKTIVKTKPLQKPKKPAGHDPVAVMLVNATEPGEPDLFYFVASRDTGAPQHMLRNMARGCNYEFLHEGSSADEMSGLVNPESDAAEERTDQILDYLQKMSRPENKFQPGVPVNADVYISLAHC